MASLLYQTIEQISREKHIEPDVIVAAIEDAMVVAARKYYRTEEELRSKFNPETGQIDVYSVHIVVDEVTDPLREISLADARKQGCERLELVVGVVGAEGAGDALDVEVPRLAQLRVARVGEDRIGDTRVRIAGALADQA